MKKTPRGQENKDRQKTYSFLRAGLLHRGKRRRLRQARSLARRQGREECKKLMIAPKVFALLNKKNRRELIHFIRRLWKAARSGTTHIHISFKTTKRMHTCGTLYFVAEAERLLHVHQGNLKLTCSYPRDRIVEQVLQKVGVLKLIGKRERIPEDQYHETVRHWHAASGTQAIGEDIDPMLQPFDGKVTPALTRSLYKAVTEAMTNCTQHAYEAPREDGVPLELDLKKWWMFSQEKDGRLHVAICDLGVGIPNSFKDKPIPGWHEVLKRFLGRSANDGLLIRAALELGKSRTDLPYRGKGLGQVIDVVTHATGGEITIHGNRGCYISRPDLMAKEIVQRFPDSIMGTLILWSVELEDQEAA